MTDGAPANVELKAYFEGTLDAAAVDRVDTWFSRLPNAEQDALVNRFLSDDRDDPQPTAIMPRETSHDPRAFTSRCGVRYQQQGPLGAGGMGLVNELQDGILGRQVAIKTSRPRRPDEHPLQYQERLRQFDHEFAILAQLEYPAITPIYDVGSDALGNPAYIMKRIEGVAFDRYLREHRCNAATIVSLIMRCAEAVAFAHSKGIIHRDIKPANIIVGEYGQVTLVDWGLAAAVGDAHEANHHGTPQWMPPEQAQGNAPSVSMDIWALGALLAFAFTREACTLAELREQRRRPSAAANAIPDTLWPLIASCLEPNIERRPLSVRDLLSELAHWQDYGALSSRLHRGLPNPMVVARKHPVAAAIALTAVVVIGVVASWYHVEARANIKRLHANLSAMTASVPFDDREAVEVALRQLHQWLHDHPHDMMLQGGIQHFEAALSVLEGRAQLDHQASLVAGIVHQYDHAGRWHCELQERMQLMEDMGLPALAHSDIMTYAERLNAHHFRDPLVVNLHYALAVASAQESRGSRPVVSSNMLSQLLNLTTAGRAHERALFMAIDGAHYGFNGPQLASSNASSLAQVLAEHPMLADALLSMMAGDSRLQVLAQQRIEHEPNAYWPNIYLGRVALRQGSVGELREHAYIAHGHHPSCFWPSMLIAYAHLKDGRYATSRRWIRQARAASPENLEAGVLELTIAAMNDDHGRVAELLDNPVLVSHLHFFMEQPGDHPVAQLGRLLRASEVHIPAAPARLGPVVLGPDTPLM